MDDLYPSPFDMNMTSKKMKFFLGDKWVDVGLITTTMDRRFIMEVTVPDIELFLIQREYLDDGTLDWLEWGPRLN